MQIERSVPKRKTKCRLVKTFRRQKLFHSTCEHNFYFCGCWCRFYY